MPLQPLGLKRQVNLIFPLKEVWSTTFWTNVLALRAAVLGEEIVNANSVPNALLELGA
jgi:hypothetical protein